MDLIKDAGLRALIASAPGTGKTPVSIVALLETYQRSLPAVVVCPASVTRNWAKEFKTWAPGIDIVLVDGVASRIPRAAAKNTVFIVSWALLDARWEELARRNVRTVVADEVHYALNAEAQRSIALHNLTAVSDGVLLLSGTPIVNTEDDLRTLFSYLRPRPGKEPLMIRRILEDVAPDIPEKKRSYVPIELRPRHRALYDKANDDFEKWLETAAEDLEDEGFSELDITRAIAAEAMTRFGYLRRLVGGFKVPAAADWIARAVRIGEPVVAFLEHQHVLKKLSRALRSQRIRHGILEGSTSPKERQRLVDSFQRHRFPVFIATRAGAEGITLHAARHLLIIERAFTSALEDQEEDRIRRIGQTYPTTIWRLHANDTLDDRLDEIVTGKRKIVRTAIGAPDTAETSSGTVEALLRAWGTHTQVERGKVLPLGIGEPLPPLPSPAVTHAIVFGSERWDPRAGLRWCRMNGYSVHTRADLGNRFKLIVHPAPVFQRGRFEIVRVSRDIRIIVGQRMSVANERVIRRTLRKR